VRLAIIADMGRKAAHATSAASDISRRSAAMNEAPMVVGPSRTELRSALDSLPEELGWNDVAAKLRPMFVRRRPMPPGAERPLTFKVPPGVRVALGVDIGPAFLYVGPSVLDGWPVTADDALAQAMINLRAAVETERYAEMEYGTVADVPLWWYQSHGGMASGLLLVEDELAKRYGEEPRLLAAPMRNLLIAAPYEADRELVEWLRDEIAYEDPNGLDLPLFALVNGELSVDRVSKSGRRLVN
jgi:hypothetical protein